ncbi:MAG: 16S rRNA (guanine(527)-N(7))-methyltransferase RsmG [Magnetovibrionaceae bacterium]
MKQQPLSPEQLQAEEGLSDPVMDRLRAYLALLEKWQKTINLVGRSTLADPWRRHVLDSLQLADWARSAPEGPWYDLGSGAGFPALVLALVTERAVICVESDARKAAFLTRVIQETGAPASVRIARIEALPKPDPGAGLITARALAGLPELLAYATPLLAPDGHCLFLKGKKAKEELTEAKKDWIFSSTVMNSRSDPDGVILQLEDIQRGELRSDFH